MSYSLADLRALRFEPDVSGFTATAVDADGVPVEAVEPEQAQPDVTVLYLHGGGYITGSPANYRGVTVSLAHAANARVYVPDYRLAPEHAFPAAYEDCLGVYRWLVSSQGVAPERLVVAGDSAGGGMVASVLAGARDEGLPLAACGVINSAFADMEGASPSLDDPARNQGRQTKAYVRWILDTYLSAGAPDPRDPRHSPVHADLTGLPPLLVQMGGLDNLHDDGLRLARQAERHGVKVTTSEYPDSAHIWIVRGTNPPDPAAERAIHEAVAFVCRHVG